MEGAADIVLIDLETRSRPTPRRPRADGARFIKANPAQRHRLWCGSTRSTAYTLADLAAIMPPIPAHHAAKVYGRADVEKLDHCCPRSKWRTASRRLDAGHRADHRDGRGHVPHRRLQGAPASSR